MAVQLHENPLQMHSVIVAYVLSVAACPLSGWWQIVLGFVIFI
jgi:hypothetical protein